MAWAPVVNWMTSVVYYIYVLVLIWQSQPPYNVTKYQPHDQPRQVAVVTDSFEQKMLASLQREMLEAGTSEEDEKKTSKLHQYDTESLSGSSDEGESTLKVFIVNMIPSLSVALVMKERAL